MDEIQSQDDYPIAGDESTNDKITDLLRDSGAFDRAPVDEARLYGGPGASLESTAKAYRQNAAESRAHRSEPDLDLPLMISTSLRALRAILRPVSRLISQPRRG